MPAPYHRNVVRHVAPADVDILYCDIQRSRLSMTKLAGKLGISRTTLHLMFKHEITMRKVYALAIGAVLQETWVSVKDKLPKDKQDVDLKGIPSGAVEPVILWDTRYFNSVGFISNVTHWRPHVS
jgi:lambda repressor-like predicted transcriptional regulator